MPRAWEDAEKREFSFIVSGNELATFSFLENNQRIPTKKNFTQF